MMMDRAPDEQEKFNAILVRLETQQASIDRLRHSQEFLVEKSLSYQQLTLWIIQLSVTFVVSAAVSFILVAVFSK